MQAAQLLDALHVFEILQEKLDLAFVKTVLFRVNFYKCLAAFFERHIERILISRSPQHTVDRGDDFFRDLAAEFDVDAASGHVGRDRHRPERARAGNDLRLFGVLACIQDLVRHTCLQYRFEPVA